MKRSLTAVLYFILPFLVLMALSFAPSEVFADKFVPNEYRIKVDFVDMSDSPRVKLGVTFLDKRSKTVDPKNLHALDVFCNDKLLRVEPELSFFKDDEVPLDLSIVMPVSSRFSENELASMVESINTQIIEVMNSDMRAGKGDRLAAFLDDGRVVNKSLLGEGEEQDDGSTKDADKVAELLGATLPVGQRAYLYSSLEKAMDDMTNPSKLREPSRRALIVVTDAFDSYIFKADKVQREIHDIYKVARENNVQIYIVMFNPFFKTLIPYFEGLSRKTRATYRYASTTGEIATSISAVGAEIFGQYVVSFEMPNAREGMECQFSVEVQHEGGLIKTEPSAKVVFERIHFNWKKFAFGCAIAFGALIVLLIVFLIVRKVRKKKAEQAEVLKEQEIQEKIEKGEVCPKCRRTLLPDWKECMFCAAALQEEMKAAKAAEAEKKAAEAKAKGVPAPAKKEERLCGKCGRAMMPNWPECFFCKAGIGAGEDAKNAKVKQGIGLAAAAGVAGAGAVAAVPEARICPVCKREMKAHWTICLYCEAEGVSAPTPSAPKQPEPAPEPVAAVRTCPDCGRPMKEHWTVCLYCEANRSR